MQTVNISVSQYNIYKIELNCILINKSQYVTNQLLKNEMNTIKWHISVRKCAYEDAKECCFNYIFIHIYICLSNEPIFKIK